MADVRKAGIDVGTCDSEQQGNCAHVDSCFAEMAYALVAASMLEKIKRESQRVKRLVVASGLRISRWG
jgi:hypothetical protein